MYCILDIAIPDPRTLSLHDALPIYPPARRLPPRQHSVAQRHRPLCRSRRLPDGAGHAGLVDAHIRQPPRARTAAGLADRGIPAVLRLQPARAAPHGSPAHAAHAPPPDLAGPALARSGLPPGISLVWRRQALGKRDDPAARTAG